MSFVNNWGFLHATFGFPPHFAAGDTPLPGSAPDYEPVLGGNPNFGGNPQMFIDQSHLTPAGFQALVGRSVDEYYLDWLQVSGPRADITLSATEGEAPLEVCADAGRSTTPEETTITTYRWDFGDGTASDDAQACHTYERAGIYSVGLTVENDAGRAHRNAESAVVHCARDDLAPWRQTDIGAVRFGGGARSESGRAEDRLVICAAGINLIGGTDSFFFLHRELTVDAVLEATLSEFEGGEPSVAAGLMMREDLSPESRYAGIVVTGSSSPHLRFYYRAEAGRTRNIRGDAVAVDSPIALRLERHGDLVVGLALVDGVDGEEWSEVGRISLPGIETLHAGAAATAGARRTLSSFESLSVALDRLELGSTEDVDRFVRGDCNHDGRVDISDAVSTLESLFLHDGGFGCDDGCDSNDDGTVNISDAVATLGVLFLGNGVIPLPGVTECGADPTEDDLGCETFSECP